MSALLRLLQLASPALPVGAYSYSEGLEWLVHDHIITDVVSLEQWLIQDFTHGSIRLEAAIMGRCYQAAANQDWQQLCYWNRWLTAARETTELREQSLQMGRSLQRLLFDIDASTGEEHSFDASTRQLLQQEELNFATVFGLAAATWGIDLRDALLGYLQSWATNLVNAGIKLIPLGQTAGQTLLFNLRTPLEQAVQAILILEDDDLNSCGWGLALASMAHEDQYSRLFRS